MTKRHLIIATRESPLALQQAETVSQLIKALHPHLSIELLGIITEDIILPFCPKGDEKEQNDGKASHGI